MNNSLWIFVWQVGIVLLVGFGSVNSLRGIKKRIIRAATSQYFSL